VLGPDATETFCRVYDITGDGNFEGRNILNLPKTLEQNAAILGRDPGELAKELADSRAKLFAAREKRIRPGRDDKVIVAWNGLMIDAMARAGAALGEPRYLEGARRSADFILHELRSADGKLLHTWRAGVAKLDAYLDDYASLANALVTLYESSLAETYIERACELINIVLKKFADPSEGGFYFTSNDHEALIARTKELTDSSTPSGNSLAAMALLRLGRLLGRPDYVDAAQRTLAAAAGVMERAPTAAGQMLLALDHYLGPARELVLVGDFSQGEGKAAIAAVQSRFLPRTVFAARDKGTEHRAEQFSDLNRIFEGKRPQDRQVALYVCEHFSCQAPVTGLEQIQAELNKLAGARQV
jgi:uncharacterized protein YyaL (SSP411 family)